METYENEIINVEETEEVEETSSRGSVVLFAGGAIALAGIAFGIYKAYKAAKNHFAQKKESETSDENSTDEAVSKETKKNFKK